MRNLKVFLALGAGLAAAVVAACSSSSNGTTPVAATDGGDDGSVGDDGSTGPASCVPLSASGLCPNKGDTCCLTGLAPGTCEAPSLCTSTLQVQCLAANNCSTGQVCCATIGGGGLAAIEDGGLGALGLDAATLTSEAGAAGLTGALAGTTFEVTCQTSCTSTQTQACASDSECVGGGACVPLSQLFASDAGIDAGALGASGASEIAALGMDKACIPPASDGGTTVVPEAGPTEAGPSDAGTASDAPVEAAP